MMLDRVSRTAGRSRHGFTIIELVVIVIIFSVIAAIAIIPNIQRVTERSKTAVLTVVLNDIDRDARLLTRVQRENDPRAYAATAVDETPNQGMTIVEVGAGTGLVRATVGGYCKQLQVSSDLEVASGPIEDCE